MSIISMACIHYSVQAQSILTTEKIISYDHTGNRLSSCTYDAMGNLAADTYKNLQFCYNLANLPSKVEGLAGSANAGLTLNYGYLSDGTKTSALVSDGSTVEGLKYRGAFVYELKNGSERLSSIAWSDGRIEYFYAPAIVLEGEGGGDLIEESDELLEIADQWFVTDHLGSTRAVVSMSQGGAIAEQNEYLPFGTRISCPMSGESNRYRFSGKEEQRFGSLDLTLSDFGARYYDPVTCRWTTRDPLAGKYHSWSPYNYCAGNPVNRIDYSGRADYVIKGRVIGKDGVDDNRVLAIRTETITKKELKETIKIIKTNSGNPDVLKNNTLVNKNTIPIEPSIENRQTMVSIVSKDSGKGGTWDANNREYGGSIENGKVVEATPGPVSNPKTEPITYIELPTNVPTFHSHPSGAISEGPPANTIGSSTIFSFIQTPSNADIQNAGTNINYVFGRGNGLVYVYDSQGVQAIIPINRFVVFKR